MYIVQHCIHQGHQLNTVLLASVRVHSSQQQSSWTACAIRGICRELLSQSILERWL